MGPEFCPKQLFVWAHEALFSQSCSLTHLCSLALLPRFVLLAKAREVMDLLPLYSSLSPSRARTLVSHWCLLWGGRDNCSGLGEASPGLCDMGTPPERASGSAQQEMHGWHAACACGVRSWAQEGPGH